MALGGTVHAQIEELRLDDYAQFISELKQSLILIRKRKKQSQGTGESQWFII